MGREPKVVYLDRIPLCIRKIESVCEDDAREDDKGQDLLGRPAVPPFHALQRAGNTIRECL